MIVHEKLVTAYHVENPATGQWLVVSTWEMKWTPNRSEATGVSWRRVEEVLKKPGLAGCLWAYAGHKVFGDDE